MPSVTLVNNSAGYNRYYYGVSESEVGPNLEQYTPGSSTNVKVGLNTGYAINNRWLLSVTLNHEWLASEITNSPIVAKDSVWSGSIGIAKVGASTSDEAVYRQLILEPLAALGLTMRDVDKFAPELHNAEMMEHAGSGDVAHKNYRMIAALAVLAGEIDKAEMNDFADAVKTAVINKRAGGIGLISGRKAFQRPMKDGVKLLNAIQDVYLCKDVKLA